ncbi:MAG: hypothetical protein Kow0059_04870 [Candidatus Sumerlaeia bacterium]
MAICFTHSTFRRAAVRVLFAAGVILQASIILSQAGDGFWRPWLSDARHDFNIDFFTLYEAGHRVWHGADAYTGAPGLAPATPYPYVSGMRYPPAAAYLLGVPLRALGRPQTAGDVWQAMLRAMLLVVLAALWRASGSPAAATLGGAAHRVPTAGGRDLFYFLGGMWLCFPPYVVEFQLGQFSLLMALLLLLAYLGWRGCRPGRAAALWTLTLLLKTWSVLFVPFLWRTGRRRTVGFGLGVLALGTVPYFILHPAGWEQFRGLNASLPQLLDWRTYVSSLSFPALFAAVFGPLVRQPVLATMWGLTVTPGRLMGWAITAALLGGAFWATWLAGAGPAAAAQPAIGRRQSLIARDALLFALWSTAFFFIYRDVWENHFIMLLPALTALALDGGVRWRWVALAFFLLAVPTPYGLWNKAPDVVAGAGAGVDGLQQGVSVGGMIGPEALRQNLLFEVYWSPWQRLLYHALRPAGVLVVYVAAFAGLSRTCRDAACRTLVAGERGRRAASGGFKGA